MALMMGSLYDALRSGGIEDDKARKAAEEVAGYENRPAAIESRLGWLTWMVGFNIAFTVGVLLKLFA